MAGAKVSVIIPVFNAEPYLRRCVESVCNQTLREIEIILVNDGSTDSSPQICDAYAGQDDRIRVLHKQNGGAGLARNSGMEVATGEYIAFLDSDDYVDLDMYESLYVPAKAENADASISGCRRVKDGKIIEVRKGALNGVYRGKEVITNVLLNAMGTEPECPTDFVLLWMSVCFGLYSMRLIRQYHLRFESERKYLSEDTLFNMEFFRRAACVCVRDEAYYNYCVNNASRTRTYRADFFKQAADLYYEQLRRVSGEWFYESAKLRIQRTYLSRARSYMSKACAQFPTYAKKKEKIQEICDTPVLQEVLAEYPWRKNPPKHMLFNLGLRYKQTWFLHALRKLKR